MLITIFQFIKSFNRRYCNKHGHKFGETIAIMYENGITLYSTECVRCNKISFTYESKPELISEESKFTKIINYIQSIKSKFKKTGEITKDQLEDNYVGYCDTCYRKFWDESQINMTCGAKIGGKRCYGLIIED